jgi:glycosyltransferase involved in cell wall biosynthesis
LTPTGSQVHPDQDAATRTATPHSPEIFMMDLLATVPYYTAYLSRALLSAGANVTVGSITYYLDTACYSSRGLRLQPGCLDIVGRYPLPRGPRRVLKLIELALNLTALSLRALVRPPAILHIQYLPLVRWPLPFDLWFAQLCRKRGSALVLTVHDLMPHDTAERYKAIFHRVYQQMDALICHSDHVRGRLELEFGIDREKVHVIPHGPFFYDLPPVDRNDVRAKYGIPAHRQLVLWQGIIFPYKGVDVLLKAWQQVEQNAPDVHLIIAGTGSSELLAELKAQVQGLGLNNVALDLRFASTEELVAIYRAADIVVYPYRAITTSGALATGLSLGKAVVASDLPVFRELLTDGETALLVSPGNIDQLAQALLTLLMNESLRHRVAEQVRAINFGPQSWQKIAASTLQVYRSALAQRGTTSPQ